MFRITYSSVLGLLAIVFSGSAIAGGLSTMLEDFQQAGRNGKASTKLAIDNDSLMLNRDDGFYSSGVQLIREYALKSATRQTTFGWRIGQELYTPSDIKLPPSRVMAPNHPYAAWLYGGFFKDVRQEDGTHLSFGLDIGCLGPCAGGEGAQTFLHRILKQPEPQGWSKQVSNEWGAILYADVAPARWPMASWLDFTPNLHGRFGNIHTDAGIGLTMRAGDLPVFRGDPALHGFLRVDGTAVGYNATLQGGYFSDHNQHTVRPKRWTGEAEAGIVWNHGAFGLAASLVRRSNEIRELRNSLGAQNFVRLLFTYTP